MKKYILVSLLILSIHINVTAQSIWTIGPMIHLNLNDKKVKCSYNLEVAYWNFNGFPWSIDGAIELERKKIRLYTEGQTGFGLGGISSGPVIEINKEEKKTTIGWQSSIWGNYYLGFDLRYRKINGKKFFCLGNYLKTGFNSKDENGNEIKSSSNSYSNWDD
jgi:hypothetical protein